MKFYQLPAHLEQDIENYAGWVNQYLAGSMPGAKLKALRVPFGVYEQREDGRYMIRIRLPGGAVTPEQLIAAGAIAEQYSNWPLHCTTRQDLQIHNLALKDTIAIMRELYKHGLSSRGSGGNTVRNITGCYRAGVDKDELFDISPYVQSLTSRMLEESDSWALPRKFKIAFSGSSNDSALATITDLGFIARVEAEGNKGFAVYIAGGLGGSPRIGIRLFDFVPAAEVYNITRAVKQLFDKQGNRRNKHKARLRFVLEKLGEDKFKSLFFEEYAAVKKAGYPELALPQAGTIRKGFIHLPLFLGDITAAASQKLGAILKPYGEDTVRLTPEQNLFIRNIEPEAVAGLEQELVQAGILTPLPVILGNAVACTGAGTCRLGICLARNLLTAVREKRENSVLCHEKLNDIRLKISGCPNTCSRHMIADIGFYGAARRCHGRMAPFYHLVTGGQPGEGKTSLAEKNGLVAARNIPDLLGDFFRFTVEERADNEAFSRFLERAGREKLNALITSYAKEPAWEEAPLFYHDWYAAEAFSLAGKTAGECSAGLFDLIELDLDTAAAQIEAAAQSGITVLIDAALQTGTDTRNKENAISESAVRTGTDAQTGSIAVPADKNAEQTLLKSALIHTCRALLITRGFEPHTDEEAVRLFKSHFPGKYVKKHWEFLLDKFFRHEALALQEVREFRETVYALYEAMDDSLKLPELAVKDDPEPNKAPFIPSYDFRGVACPLNFVKTKLVLENTNPGSRIEILLDDGAPADNVPASVKEEGHKIISREAEGSYWSVVIEKV